MKVKKLVIEKTNGELAQANSVNIDIENNVLEGGCVGYPLYNISNYSFIPEDSELKKWVPEEKEEEVLSPEKEEKVPKEEIKRMRECIERYCINHSCSECLILSSCNECPHRKKSNYRSPGCFDLTLEKDENIIKYYYVLKRVRV